METKNQNLTTSQKNSNEEIQKPPVVVVLGHIDHGKSTLLNCIRKIQFTGEKPGGLITQHIGAYQVEKEGKKITFIDTPGHEAFSAMRSRGAKVADIAILVIDATQGIQTQTKEAISHIKKAQIPLIIALNKIDQPSANPEKVKRELQKEGVLVEDFGGKIPSVKTSAKTGEGIEELLELIILMAEMEDLKANIAKPATGVIIESYLDNQRGPTATLILVEGVLKIGDIVATPTTIGRVRTLEDFQGKAVDKIFPADPGIIIGFVKVPKVGEDCRTFPDIEKATAYLKREDNIKVSRVLEIGPEQKVLNLILKTDVLGSAEAIEEILKELPQEKVILRILKSEAGEVKESDIKLAQATKAIILTFRVGTDLVAKQLAEREKIKIISSEIIYDLVEEVRKLIEKITKPEVTRENLGKVKVLAVFLIEKNRQIVGGRVVEGTVRKGAKIEVFRNEELIGKGKLVNLQKNKKDIEKLNKGEECGILFEGDVKIEKGDTLLIYTSSPSH